MAEITLPPPSQLVIDITSTTMIKTWESWIETLEMYFTASQIDDGAQQKALLLYLGGEDLRKIHRTLGDDQATYTHTKELLRQYFKPLKNITFERYQFFSSIQGVNETTMSYITRLRDIARNCEFDTYNNNLAIVDQVISKCHSHKLRRQLLRETDLNLEKMVKIAAALETSDLQAIEIEKSEDQVNKLGAGHKSQTSSVLRKNSTDFRKDYKDTEDRHCYGCGSDRHLHGSKDCRAKGKRCNYCKAMNHFEAVCLKRLEYQLEERDQGIRTMNTNVSDSDEDWIFAVTNNSTRSDVVLKVDDQDVSFMVDSGASVNIIDYNTFQKLSKKVNIILKPSSSRIFTYGSDSPMTLKGSFVSNVCYGHNIHVAKIHVSSSLMYTRDRHDKCNKSC